MMDKYEYGHPFYYFKPDPSDFQEEDFIEMLLELFQDGHCFLNGLRNTPAHPDSYMTVLDYNNVAKSFKIIQEEYSLSKEIWVEFANFWIDHINKQMTTWLLGKEILRLIK